MYQIDLMTRTVVADTIEEFLELLSNSNISSFQSGEQTQPPKRRVTTKRGPKRRQARVSPASKRGAGAKPGKKRSAMSQRWAAARKLAKKDGITLAQAWKNMAKQKAA